jgi:hypothetical protein
LKKFLLRYFSRHHPDLRIAAVRENAGAAPMSPRREIAVECVEDPFYLVVFTALCRAGGLSECDLVVPRSAVSGLVNRSWGYRLAHALTLGSLVGRQWSRTYDTVGRRIAYRGFSIGDLITGVADWYRSRRLWRSLADSKNIFALRVLDVQVGDLVIDSYLRFRPAPRFDIQDPFVASLLWQAHRDVRRARRYFRHCRPRLYVTTFATYIEHGVPVRVALQEGIEVRTFGNFVQPGKRLTMTDSFHMPTTSGYRRDFAALCEPEQRLARAEAQLRGRLEGKIDEATSYMKVSAYQNAGVSIPDVRGAVIVFLHDFYDSPHIYDDLVFHDFWDWVTCTIEALAESGVPFFLKPHPNQVEASGDVINVLRGKYPAVSILPMRATNVQLAEAGMLCGVTMYGTVAHELGYLGIPTIACARHPHHAFDFCRTAKTLSDYVEMLHTPALALVDARAMREQALIFYYMHNLHGTPEELKLRANISRLWKASHDPDASISDVVGLYESLRDSPCLASMLQIESDGRRSANSSDGNPT